MSGCLLGVILLPNMKKLKSLTIFFPFFNDAGTVDEAINQAYKHGREVAQVLEVIAIHGGKSTDNTLQEIKKQKKKYTDLIIIDKTNNWERYGVIKYGFLKASKEWVFYTDGDLQYSLKDLAKLVDRQQKTKADVVNGYRKHRLDSVIRMIGGNLYRRLSKVAFKLPIDDLECDFRLIRSSFVKKINFKTHDSSILLELIKQLELHKARFAEVEINHYPRRYGSSTYTPWSLIKEKLPGDWKVWKSLKKKI